MKRLEEANFFQWVVLLFRRSKTTHYTDGLVEFIVYYKEFNGEKFIVKIKIEKPDLFI